MMPPQVVQALAVSPALLAIRNALDAGRVVRDAITIQQIPAPTFDEAKRAAYLKERFAGYPLQDVAVDEVYNVYGRWPGTDATRPALLISAHTDTVFSADTDLRIRRENDLVFGPGLGDNSLGVAGLLALLDCFSEHDIRPAVDIWFVANSREEGLGDLGGIRAVWETLHSRLGAALVIEGMALGHIYHAGIAARRLRIACRAAGGHSWLHFGQPTAVHGLVELGAHIIALAVPEQPRTTFNIGMISGGHSINSLAMHAELYLDLRSEEPDSLAVLEQQVLDVVEQVGRPGLDFAVEVVGNRPAGRIPADHPLVTLASAALAEIGYPAALESGSTDANLLLANGLPAVTVGVSHGKNAHRLDEHIDTAPIANGIWQLVLLALATADALRDSLW